LLEDATRSEEKGQHASCISTATIASYRAKLEVGEVHVTSPD
jgi:hypothetical protein